MNKVRKSIQWSLFSFLVTVLLPGCAPGPGKVVRWEFDSLDGWVYAHQDTNPDHQVEVENGMARIFTRAGSTDRKKIRTEEKIYTTGRYSWRAFVPVMKPGDQASVGVWIYHDDEHEIDFEVGSGKQEVREELGAGPEDVVAYMTTQAHPFQSVPVRIKSGWHVFELDLSLRDGNYYVQWIIDGKTVAEVQQTFGNEYAFYIFCSVENLKFIGDHPPVQDNYGLFDWVQYTRYE